jgi:hypothetical protein
VCDESAAQLGYAFMAVIRILPSNRLWLWGFGTLVLLELSNENERGQKTKDIPLEEQEECVRDEIWEFLD